MAAPKTRNGVCEKCQGKGWYYINPTDEVDDFERMECDCGARVREEDAELAVV
jgi:excinuclease UvrABC ATPase subunit